MKVNYTFSLLIFLFMACTTKKESAHIDTLKSNIVSFYDAMVRQDMTILNSFASSSITYGHSNGAIERKDDFLNSIESGKFRFLEVKLSEESFSEEGESTIIVRHNLYAKTHDAGKDIGEIKLHILMLWQNVGGKWLLVARQSARLPI